MIQQVPLRELFWTWLYIGFVSFGGPSGQIALMHRIIVDEKNWIKEQDFLHALNFCMLLPGPEAMQLATYCGWRTNSTLGAFMAGLLFILPGAFLILILAFCYVNYGELNIVQNAFLGIKAAVIIIIVQALYRISNKTLQKWQHWLIAILAFIGLYFFNISYPLIIISAALLGLFLKKQSSASYFINNKKENNQSKNEKHNLPNIRHVYKIILIGVIVWLSPIILLMLFKQDDFLVTLLAFFAKLSVLSFGGAYAVLGYMQQAMVIDYAWISSQQMVDALGLAETTPGPLILVTEFSAYLAAYQHAGHAYALIAAGTTLWVTFVPSFLWILLGAPYINWLSNKPSIHVVLSAITAAIVGVILSIALWFSIVVLFNENLAWYEIRLHALNLNALLLCMLASILLLYFKTNIILTLCVCAITAIVLLS